jgi:hypothetical protein
MVVAFAASARHRLVLLLEAREEGGGDAGRNIEARRSTSMSEDCSPDFICDVAASIVRVWRVV